MADFSDTLVRLGAVAYSVIRRVSTGFTNGIRNAPTTSNVSITALLVPVTGQDLLKLPEGLRQQDIKKIHSLQQVHVQSATNEPDLITIGGGQWQVEHVEDWNALGAFYKALLIKAGT